MAIRINKPFDQYFEADGTPLDNGYLYIGTANLNPVIAPIATYWDEALTQPAAQPLRTMNGYLMRGNSPGRVYIGNTDYSIMLKSSNGTVIWSASSAAGDAIIDVLNLFAAPDGSDLIGYTAPDTLDVMTVQDRLEWLDGVSPQTANNDSYAGSNVYAFRDASGVAGGTPGFVNAAITSITTTGATETAFEWNILGVLDNYSAAGENVAAYFQGNKRSTGPTWGSVSEAKDHTGTANPTAGLIGIEVDLFANGGDSNGRRLGIDLVIGKGVPSGATPDVYAGMRFIPFNGDYTNGEFIHGILMDANMETAIRINNNSGDRGIYMTGTMVAGIDLVGTYSAAAIRMEAGHKLAFDALSTVYLQEVAGALGVDGGWFNFSQGFGVTSAGNTQTTRGAAGAATALPANPTGYLKFRLDGVQDFVIPYYARA